MSAQPQSPAPVPQPFCFRLPANGETDPWFGGTRTFWAELIRSNGHPAAVHSFTRKIPGAKRGIRFIEFESARSYMAGLCESQRGEVVSDESD